MLSIWEMPPSDIPYCLYVWGLIAERGRSLDQVRDKGVGCLYRDEEAVVMVRSEKTIERVPCQAIWDPRWPFS